MRDTFALLEQTDFPPIRRARLDTVQANLGYRCNQSCTHCHVAAGPKRREAMSRETMHQVLELARRQRVSTLDLTGGAPELHPYFRELVTEARALGLKVIDRCNLTVLNEPGQETLAGFLAGHGVEITASLPCYLAENVNQQRGAGVFESSLLALRQLNALGYGLPASGRVLNLVYNPGGPSLPPAQAALEAAYKERLATQHGVVFNRLLVLANMPIRRFANTLLRQNGFESYLALLKNAHRADNLDGVMCRRLVSIGWRGEVFDCDFNQMLDLPLGGDRGRPVLLADLLAALPEDGLAGRPIAVADHCYGCTAGQGSSCGGALTTQPATADAT